MSTQTKLIVALLDEDITKNDFSKKSGFVNAYTYNKDKPDLLSHLFLLYDGEDRNYEKAKTIEKMTKLKSLYSRKGIWINKHYYLLYTIVLIGKKMRNLLQGIPSFEESDVTKTLKFWNMEEDDVNRILLGIDPSLSIDDTSVPEEDYSIPDITTESGYKESLAMNTLSGFFRVSGYYRILHKTFYYLPSFL